MSEKILVITGGGDCPGLNPTIRALTLAARARGWNVFGSRNAFHGIFAETPQLIELTEASVIEIHSIGGTILGTSNKGVPSSYPVKDSTGKTVLVDRTDELIQKIKNLGFTAVINIGGDGSQRISYDLFKRGVPIVGIPKTIDNDLAFTDFTFGFRTAVDIATDAIDKLVTTARSHQRIMILEVMGRDAGWIALNAGIAGGADIILLPEVPFDTKSVIDKVNHQQHRDYTIIVVAEGAFPKGAKVIGRESSVTGYENIRLGGVGKWLAEQLDGKVDKDVRVSVLGHLQRGGSPNSLDRIIAAEFGVKAIELIEQKHFGQMTSYHYPEVESVPLEIAIRQNKYVDVNSALYQAALQLGISFGN
jgi:6-phosphofructokinase 1